MSLTLLKIMEEVGSRQTGRIAAYVNEGLKEIAELIPDKVERATISIVSGTRLYSLPSNKIELKGVFQQYNDDDDSDKYIRIGRISSLDIIQDDTASSVSNDDDIIII